MEDVFAVQTEVAEQVAGQLGGYTGTVLAADRASAARKRPSDLTAYDLYLLATEDKRRETKESVTEAIDLLNRSLQIDPNFARAWMVLGSCYAIALRWTDNWDETHALYEKYMRRAVELDPMDAEAHAGLGFALAHDGDLKQAEAEFVEALRLNPNSADVLTRYAFWASSFGKPDEGAAMAELAIRLKPNAPPWAIGSFAARSSWPDKTSRRCRSISDCPRKCSLTQTTSRRRKSWRRQAGRPKLERRSPRRWRPTLHHDRELDRRSWLDRRGSPQGDKADARGRLSRLREQGGGGKGGINVRLPECTAKPAS